MEWIAEHWQAIVGLIGAVVGLIGAVSGLWARAQQRKDADRTQRVAEAANAINSYAKLCQDLQEERAALLREVQRLQAGQVKAAARLAELEQTLRGLEAQRAQWEAERDAWAVERAELTAQIGKLEAKNRELERRVDALQAEARAREGDGK